MSTARDLVKGSLRLIGVLASGEDPTSDEANDAFSALNGMVDSMSNQRLLIWSILRESFALTVNQAVYTMGVGGNFNTVRPQKIENSLITIQSSPETELPMRIINKDEYSDVRVKSTTSSIPLYLYNDDAYPLANLSLWPVPDLAVNLILYSWKPLVSFTSLDTVLSMPPGYFRMLKYNLALELAPEYGKEVNAAVLGIANDSKADLKRKNTKSLYLKVDPALAGPKGTFNYLTGDTV